MTGEVWPGRTCPHVSQGYHLHVPQLPIHRNNPTCGECPIFAVSVEDNSAAQYSIQNVGISYEFINAKLYWCCPSPAYPTRDLIMQTLRVPEGMGHDSSIIAAVLALKSQSNSILWHSAALDFYAIAQPRRWTGSPQTRTEEEGRKEIPLCFTSSGAPATLKRLIAGSEEYREPSAIWPSTHCL